MFNVGPRHVALEESTGASVRQADGLLCRTRRETTRYSLCSQMHRAGLQSPPNAQMGGGERERERKKKAVALEL